MANQTRKCPRCGHENVARALFCFQCGRNLSEVNIVDGAQGTGKLVSDAMRFIKERGYTFEPGESRMKTVPDNLIGEPLVCLHCGTLNRSDAQKCSNCATLLAVPDEDFNLAAHPSARTNIGSVRHNNEDNLSLWAIDGVLIAVVADGMGGAAAGEEASRLAVEAVQADFLGESRGSEKLTTLSENELSTRLADAIRDANRAVYDKTQVDPRLKGMGTTSTLAMIRANRAMIAHVGDSRLYHIEGATGLVTQVTTDHSFVQALVASGHITPDQARSHPMGNVLYRALGQSDDVDVDMYKIYVHAEDRLLLCSDGLTRHILPEELGAIVMDDPNPHVATQRLIELANARGGEDNISAIVIRIVQAVADETLPHMPVIIDGE